MLLLLLLFLVGFEPGFLRNCVLRLLDKYFHMNDYEIVLLLRRQFETQIVSGCLDTVLKTVEQREEVYRDGDE